jgi:hypothetical protein
VTLRRPDATKTDGGETADLVAAAALAVPGVVALHAGSFGEVATYLPGRRVTGVRVRDDVTEVHVVLDVEAPVLATADAVRAAAGPLVATRLDVCVQDLAEGAP